MAGFTERELPADTTLNGVGVYYGDKRIGTVWHSSIWGWQWAYWLKEGWTGGQCASKDEGCKKIIDESGEGPCTDCEDTGITIQTERPCSCGAGEGGF